MGRCYEDFEVGTRLESKTLTVSAEEIVEFAARYDPQPFHLDEAAARATFFKGLAASGWHTAALTMRLVVETLRIEGGVVGAGVDELRWPNALRPGDTIHVKFEVLEARLLRTRPGVGLVRVRTETVNQRGETVQSIIPSMFVPTRAR